MAFQNIGSRSINFKIYLQYRSTSMIQNFKGELTNFGKSDHKLEIRIFFLFSFFLLAWRSISPWNDYLMVFLCLNLFGKFFRRNAKITKTNNSPLSIKFANSWVVHNLFLKWLYAKVYLGLAFNEHYQIQYEVFVHMSYITGINQQTCSVLCWWINVAVYTESFRHLAFHP